MIRSMPRPTQTRADLVRKAAEIWDDENPPISYMASLFVQCSLPYRDPGDVPVWSRRNGDRILRVQPGYRSDEHGNDVSLGYPSGVMPRLLLNWMSTQAVQLRSPDLDVGNSLRGFMTKLGVKPTGGKNGSIRRLRTAMEQLFRARLSVHSESSTHQAGKDLSIASAWELHWSSRGDEAPEQQSLLQSSMIRLSQPFYEEVVSSPVPVSMDALVALKGSALRMDIYTWLTYRMSYLGQPTRIPYASLANQFGSRVAPGNRVAKAGFKRDFWDHLAKVLVVYNQARVEDTGSCLMLYPSPTHVSLPGLWKLSRELK